MNPPSHECTRCLYTTRHPFGLTLDAEGLCSGCRTHEEKFNLDWAGRRTLLERRVAERRGRRRTSDYDCVVPVRGTPEYFKVLDVVKNQLGLNPLVVAYNSQFNSRAGIMNLDLLRDTFDVDLLHYTSNPVVYRKLIRESLARFHSVRWPFLAGETQLPVQVAVEKNIPLIIWPSHQPTEQVGAHSYTEEPAMTRRSRHEFDLMGCEPAELVTVESLVQARDVEDLAYPADRLLARKKVHGLYLANYLPWDGRRYAEDMIARFGALAAHNSRTFDTYDRIDDRTYMTVHDLLKAAKLGYSRVTDSLCREIRFGRITKADARALEHYYQTEIPEAEIATFCAWLGIPVTGFRWFGAPGSGGATTGSARPALSVAQQAFIGSFQVNAPPVADGARYIVYGKGLSVEPAAA